MRQMQIMQKSIKTEQHVKIDFFENLMLLISKSGQLIKVRSIPNNKRESVSVVCFGLVRHEKYP
jgi:hypothetical protein